MKTFIALFRGINVGGRNILPMKDLKRLLEEQGYQNVQTYIQSGNVVFQSREKPDTTISTLIERKFGFKPDVFILSRTDFDLAVENNPYQPEKGKYVHFFFCRSKPEPGKMEKLEALKTESEEFTLTGKVFYLHAPDGIGRSKLAAKVGDYLGVSVTARNLNTIRKLSEMAQEKE